MLHDFRYATEDLENNPITCPTLLVLGNENKPFHNFYKPALDVFKKWDHLTIKYIDGGHDAHNNNPENVAPPISKFLHEESKLILNTLYTKYKITSHQVDKRYHKTPFKIIL